MKILFLIMFVSSIAFGAKTLKEIDMIICSVNPAMTAVVSCGIYAKMDYGTDVGGSVMRIKKLDHVLTAGEQTDIDALMSTLKSELETQEGI